MSTARALGLAALLVLSSDCTVGASGITYEGSGGDQLGMALGGLGTSTLEIGRDGAFQNVRLQNDWTSRIGPTPAATFLSVYTRSGSGKAAGRVLQLEAPQGLEPVAGLTYTGRFPFAEIKYQDPALGCEVQLEAFSPFVPQDAASSSLPVIFFTFRLRNPTAEPVTAAVALSWVNDIAAETHRGGLAGCRQSESATRSRGAGRADGDDDQGARGLGIPLGMPARRGSPVPCRNRLVAW